MKITGVIWLRNVIDKLLWKHNVPIPRHFKTIEEAADFWDSHDLAEYLDQTREVSFEVDLQRRVFLTALEPDLAKRLADRAHKEGVSTETLVNVWLSEKLAERAPEFLKRGSRRKFERAR